MQDSRGGGCDIFLVIRVCVLGVCGQVGRWIVDTRGVWLAGVFCRDLSQTSLTGNWPSNWFEYKNL